MIASVDELRRAVEGGQRFPYVFFWRHHPSADGVLGASCLSQWWPCRFTVDGVTYTSAEQWMMAAKARLFGDDEALAAMLATDEPDRVKALGRAVRNFESARWSAACAGIVTRGNLAKFGQSEPLREFLLGTGDAVLAEASPTDVIWGIGLDASDERASDPREWRGASLLGFALMRVRERLR